jgi:hypothetical protein
VNGYYTTSDGTTYTPITESTPAAEGVTYYDKYMTVANAVYGIKVIKVKP